MSEKIKLIPYGVSDFADIQYNGRYFVDKTRFIHLLEEHKYIFFIRPRRFGKSLWLSILRNYYDIHRKDEFEALFKNTDIGKNPTPEQSSYLMMRFDFSQVYADIKEVEESFRLYGTIIIEDFVRRYHNFFDSDFSRKLESLPTVATKLSELFIRTAEQKLKIYMLIDEYDNFTNTILSTQGTKAYYDLTRGEGFFRHFFAILKGATGDSNSGLSRLFITGVSPVTLDDVTSGFNIGKNLSLSPNFNEMVGFTEHEARTLLEYYKSIGRFTLDIDEGMKLMHEWYDGYIFSKKATTSMFNSDMVLYFAGECHLNQGFPEYLIDPNVRIDYGKLRHLMLISKQIKKLNGNFDHLKSIIEKGEIVSTVNQSFPLDQLLEPENFISLLYYFGLVSFGGTKHGGTLLKIPNIVIWKLMYGYIRDAYKDVEIFRVNIWKLGDLTREMAWFGKWKELFDFLAQEVEKQTSVRDYLQGEKVIQGFLLAYLSINDFFIPHTEKELNKGFCDFFLEPFLTKYPDMPYGYIIELKYIPRGEKLTEAVLKKSIEDAKKQVCNYAKDKLVNEKYNTCTIIKLILVYHGWDMVYASKI